MNFGRLSESEVLDRLDEIISETSPTNPTFGKLIRLREEIEPYKAFEEEEHYLPRTITNDPGSHPLKVYLSR